MKSMKRGAFLDTVPIMYRGLTLRAFAGVSTPRAAIKAKCLDCSHYDRAEIADCLVVLCPLHAFRPYQQKARKLSVDASSDALGHVTPHPS